MDKQPNQEPRLKYARAKMHSSEQVELVRVSLDEFNLATFPVSVLDKKAQRSHEPLQFHDVIVVGGRQIERQWKVFPHAEEGFPGPADDDVLMALFELTREQGGAKKIFFTRYQLCKKLGWPLNTFYYSRIESSFRKLAGIHIEATNAFGDQERKKFINMGFSIIQEYKLFDETAGREKLSYVLWSDRIAASISQKLTKYLDASFYFEELETPLEKRLFRYLDNQFELGQAQLSLDIHGLCYEHLGVARRYRYTSQLMQKLEGPLQKLVDKGFLQRWRLEGEILWIVRAEGFASRVTFSIPYSEMLSDISAVTQSNSQSNAQQTIQSNSQSNPQPTNQNISSENSTNKRVFRKKAESKIIQQVVEKDEASVLVKELALRGVELGVAKDIISRTVGCEEEIMEAIKYFDAECARGKKFDNPGGLLVSLIRKCLPAEQLPPSRSPQVAKKATTSPTIPTNTSTKKIVYQKNASTTDLLTARAELQYQEYVMELGRETYKSLSLVEQKRLLSNAQSELQSGIHANKYRRMSSEKFAEHLRTTVETQLSRQLALPFEEWYQQWLINGKKR
ncbi:MAG: replication initiator protein A [Acidobacteria bacterium]|nr:replication initiator protein A [Acidobacteriota bacterium]